MERKIVKKGKSTNGTSFTIRYPKATDVVGVWKYINKLSKEKTYIRFQGEEIPLEDEEKYVKECLKKISENKSVVLFLIVDNKIHGICGVDLHDKTENHIASLGLSVDRSVRGQGLGKELLEVIIEEAKKKLKGLHIIKLDVKHPNTIAINLYKQLGFEQYGHLPHGTIHQDEFVDMIFMYKKV